MSSATELDARANHVSDVEIMFEFFPQTLDHLRLTRVNNDDWPDINVFMWPTTMFSSLPAAAPLAFATEYSGCRRQPPNLLPKAIPDHTESASIHAP